MGLVVMGAVFLPRLGLAHTLGVSTAEFQVTGEGPVEARLTFATAEPLGKTDPRNDADLRAFVLDGVDVAADGVRCAARYEGAGITELDGLALEATYGCPPDTAEIAVTLYYLSALSPGHREIARIVGPPGSGASVEGVLTGDRRGIVLKLPVTEAAAEKRRREVRARRVTALTVSFAAVMAALFVWRWRATRKK
jgi:hypothetical protein